MKNNQDEFNFKSHSHMNSLDKYNFLESPISSFHNYLSINNNNNNNYNNFIKETNTSNIMNLLGDKYLNTRALETNDFPSLKEEYLNNILNETKYIQNDYNNKKSKLIKENEEINEKKKKLINVYHCLYDFRNKLLNKEKELNDKQNNLEQYENVLKKN